MQDSPKYLIHADVHTNGVVERSDVVGAIFGQTEGLLGDDLDLRTLQESSKVGRIDVQIQSSGGRSDGTVTVASGLDRVETAILAASLETIDRVGPCRAEFEVTELEDVRSAKRRSIVDRATELLQAFEAATRSSQDIVEEVREEVRVADVTTYEGLPAGPRVDVSDAIIVVEGRADVVRLLRYGIKNAIAVEGTDIPDALASLTGERTVTAFLDGDRGGDLIMKELGQLGDVDFVTFAPGGKSVEDLARDEVMEALRRKVPFEDVATVDDPRSVVWIDEDDDVGETDKESGAGEGSADTAEDVDPPEEPHLDPASTDGGARSEDSTEASAAAGPAPSGQAALEAHGEMAAAEAPESDGEPPGESKTSEKRRASTQETPQPDAAAGTDSTESGDTDPDESETPRTLAGHVATVIENVTAEVRFLDEEFAVLETGPADDAHDRLLETTTVPRTVVIDDRLSQRLLDVAAQRGVEQVVAREIGEFVKRPATVRLRTADQF